MKLTRRERAAMELALAALRHSALITTRTTDGGAEQLSQCAIREAGIALAVGFSGLARPIVDTEAEWGRVIRARLALYLRARLRAEGRGEIGFGRWVCAGCGSEDLRSIYEQAPRFVGDEWRPACRTCGGEQTDYTCRVTPLWELAPSHGGGR